MNYFFELISSAILIGRVCVSAEVEFCVRDAVFGGPSMPRTVFLVARRLRKLLKKSFLFSWAVFLAGACGDEFAFFAVDRHVC